MRDTLRQSVWLRLLPVLFALTAAAPAFATLAERVSTAVLTLPEPLAASASNWGTWGSATFTPRLYLAPATATRDWVGWTDAGGDGHVSRVDFGVFLLTDDFNGQPIGGLVSLGAESYAVLVRDTATGTARVLRRMSGTMWSTPLVSAFAVPTDAVGDSRLAYGNGTFVARLSMLGTSSPYAGHYGEQCLILNDAGAVLAGGWPWGASHQIGALAAVHEQTGQVLTLGTSDCYPSPGILAGQQQLLHPAFNDCAGRVSVNLGQMVATPGGWLVAFNGLTNGAYTGHGVGLLHLDAALNTTVSWLTATSGADERDPVLARIGIPFTSNRYLTGWRNAATGEFRLAVIDAAGTFVEAPEVVSTAGIGWGTRDDSFRTAPDGSVRWLEGQGGATTLELHTFYGYVSGAPLPAFAAPTLAPNVPNPFNPSTMIAFELPVETTATLTVHDLSGRLLRTLLPAAVREAGHHEVTWNGRDERGGALPAGVYVARLAVDGTIASVRMTLLK